MANMSTVKGVFKHHIPSPAVKVLAKKIAAFEVSFRTRNKDHIRFFGGHILGADKVRFLQADFDRWWDDVLKVEPTDLQDDLINTDTINGDWSVSSSAFNLSIIWLVHIFWNSQLPKRVKHQAIINTLIIFHYRLITSRLVRNFKFLASPELMETVYAAMSKKYLIKQYGTWYRLLEGRAESNVSKDSPHTRRQTWQRLNDDANVIYAINDNSTRLSSIFKEHYKLINEIKESDSAMVKTLTHVRTDEGMEIAELKRKLPELEQYIFSILPDKHSFIKGELKYVVQYAMHKMPPKLFTKTLEDMCKEYQSDEVKDIVEKVLIHAFTYLFDHYEGRFKTPNPAEVLDKLRGVYTSSKGKDERLLSLRKRIEAFIRKRNRSSSGPSIAATRTGVMLYIVLRAMTRTQYAN